MIEDYFPNVTKGHLKALYTHIVIEGKPMPAKILKSRTGLIYNARKDYIEQSKWIVALLYHEDLSHKKPLIEGPVKIYYLFGMKAPLTWSKKKKESAYAGNIPHVTKPDYDNLKKTYNDIIKGVVIKDDNQITSGEYLKKYEKNPRVEIWIYAA